MHACALMIPADRASFAVTDIWHRVALEPELNLVMDYPPTQTLEVLNAEKMFSKRSTAVPSVSICVLIRESINLFVAFTIRDHLQHASNHIKPPTLRKYCQICWAFILVLKAEHTLVQFWVSVPQTAASALKGGKKTGFVIMVPAVTGSCHWVFVNYKHLELIPHWLVWALGGRGVGVKRVGHSQLQWDQWLLSYWRYRLGSIQNQNHFA